MRKLLVRSILALALCQAVNASAFARSAQTNHPTLVSRGQVTPRWFADASGQTNLFWYRLDLAQDKHEFILGSNIKP